MENKKIQTTQEYIDSAHKLGRTGGVLALIIMFSFPIIAGIYFDATPNIVQVFAASAGLLAIFVPTAISEVLAYTPILGSSIYLTLVTGNVTNLKIPVVNNALKVLDVKNGSEDADAIGAIAVSVSTFFTLFLIALGVLLMVPLKPILEAPAVATATAYILPALFGSMGLAAFSDSIGGGVRAPGRMKAAILPAVLVAAIHLLDKYVLHTGLVSLFNGVLILLMLPIAWFGSKYLMKKGQIKVLLPGEEKETTEPKS